ncbi:NHLP family bacteriocin export ABC transporter peptidase/permease/ATPase subunit [Tistrella mobilis]|uniref:NHLP family bacteriocin export ABC transporter peptidase/permease/ATPase subunit n=1 Tax=Tistrella mobilis TaxID=171437 RepID=UPI0031F68EE6
MTAPAAAPAAPESLIKPNAPQGGRRFRVPTILQMEATECGAASLAMIMAHHGLWLPLEVLRRECGVSRDGSKAANLLRAARRYGFEARGYRREPDSVVNLPFPMIVFWNFNHFVVLEGVDAKRDRVWINDPAMGPRAMTVEEFDQGFTGVCLAFRPTPEFKRGGRPPGLFKAFAERLRGSGPALAMVLMLTLMLVLPGLALPVFSKLFVDGVLIGDEQDWLKPLLIGIGLTAIIRAGLDWAQMRYLARLELKLAISGSAKLLWHVFRLPVEFFLQRYHGDVAMRVESGDRIAQLLSGEFATNAVGLVTMVFYAVVMIGYSPLLGAVGIGLALVNAVVLKLAQRAREDGGRRLAREQGALAATSMSGIQLLETLKASGGESDFFARWAGVHARYLNALQQVGRITSWVNAVPAFMAALTSAVILGIGGLEVMSGAITVGGLVAVQSLLASFSAPIAGLMQFGGELHGIKGQVARIDDVLRYDVDPTLDTTEKVMRIDAPSGRRLPQRLRGEVRIENLTFGYNKAEAPLIDDFSLTIRPGQRVALVGGSGSGKSTVARVVCGLYRPWSGRVLFDGIPAEDLPHAYFAGSIASVDQDIFLFEGTVRENVTMWDDTISEAAVTRALRDAALLDLIEARPGRYDSPVAENGANFSGGQRQRLEIARALVGDPAVLILDEATSALDTQIEKIIDERLRHRGCTCLIVAHRLSTIRDCDEIIVLERGRIAQRGRHEDMIREDGPYARLIRSEQADAARGRG